MNNLLLREVCRLTGASRRAIQGYEKTGLVSPCGKNKQGYLLYDRAIVAKIKRVKLFQERGFSLKEIKGFEALTREDFKFILIQKIIELKNRQSCLKDVATEIQTIIADL